MLEAFHRLQEIDILLVQEITHHVFHDIQGYTTQYNIGAYRRGTVFIAKDGIILENIQLIPSGHATAA